MSLSPGWNLPGFPLTVAPGWVSGAADSAPVVVTWGDQVLRTEIPSSPETEYVALIEPYQLKGWWDSAPDDTSDMQHWTGDGSVHGLLRRRGRTIEVRGVVSAVDNRRLLEAKRAFARQRVAKFVVAETGLVSEADVRLVTLQWSDINLSHSRFSLTLLASDPLRYSGSQVLTNGSNVLVNRGDSDAFPVVSVRGPHDGYTIEHPGGTFHYPATGTATRIVDCRNGDVWRLATGERVFPSGLSGPWPVVPAGGATWVVSGLGSGPNSVKRFEAWS